MRVAQRAFFRAHSSTWKVRPFGRRITAASFFILCQRLPNLYKQLLWGWKVTAEILVNWWFSQAPAKRVDVDFRTLPTVSERGLKKKAGGPVGSSSDLGPGDVSVAYIDVPGEFSRREKMYEGLEKTKQRPLDAPDDASAHEESPAVGTLWARAW